MTAASAMRRWANCGPSLLRLPKLDAEGVAAVLDAQPEAGVGRVDRDADRARMQHVAATRGHEVAGDEVGAALEAEAEVEQPGAGARRPLASAPPRPTLASSCVFHAPSSTMWLPRGRLRSASAERTFLVPRRSIAVCSHQAPPLLRRRSSNLRGTVVSGTLSTNTVSVGRPLPSISPPRQDSASECSVMTGFTALW